MLHIAQVLSYIPQIFAPFYTRKPLSFAAKQEKYISKTPPHLLGSLSGHYLLYLECKRNTSERLLRAKEN